MRINIDTKYKIGQIIYVARVVNNPIIINRIIDCVEYKASIDKLVPKIKEKIITDISIKVNRDNTVNIKYHTDDNPSYHVGYEEKNGIFETYNEALQFADKWIDQYSIVPFRDTRSDLRLC